MSYMSKLVEDARVVAKNRAESKAEERKRALDEVVKFLLDEFKITQKPLVPISHKPVLVGSPMWNKISSRLVATCGADWEDRLAEAVLPEGMHLYSEQKHVRIAFSYDPDRVQSDN